MKRLFTLLLIAFVALSVVFAGGAQESKTTSQAKTEKVVTIAQTGNWDTFMPMNTTNQGSDNLIDLMFERLMVIKTDGTFDPRLASSWETNEASDVITYHLNPNAKWTDGTPVTAEDVVYSAQVASSAEFAYPRRIRMQYFKGTDDSGMELAPNSIEVIAVDDHTVQFNLKSPMDPTIIYALINRDFYIIPSHLLKDIPDDKLATDSFWQNPVGDGPCIFDSQIAGERVEFKANKDYYLGAPDFDRLVYRVVTAPNLLAGLMSGEIDVTSADSSIPLTDWDAAKSAKNIETMSLPSFGYQTMVVNTQHLPQEVRQAINIAVNRDTLVQSLLLGEGRPVIGPLVENHPYFNQAMLPIEYNPEKAAQIIKNSGFDTSKTLKMLVSTGNTIRQNSAVLIQQDLQKIGLKVEIQTLDFPTLLTNTRNGDFDFSFIGFQGSIDPTESVPNVTVGYLNNFSQLTDPTLGEIGMKSSLLANPAERHELMDQYQLLIKEQVPYVYLYSQNQLVAHTTRVSNIPTIPVDLNTNKCVWLWKVQD